MAKRYEELGEQLDELALHFKLDGQGRTARDCQLAAAQVKQVEFIPPDPSELDDVSRRVRDYIAEYRGYGEIPILVEMREKHPYLKDLTRVAKIGPKTAKTINQETGASNVEDIRQLADSGELEDVSGIGPKTATTIRRSIAQLK